MIDKDCKIKNHICRMIYSEEILYIDKEWFICRSNLKKLLNDVSKKYPKPTEDERNSEQHEEIRELKTNNTALKDSLDDTEKKLDYAEPESQ